MELGQQGDDETWVLTWAQKKSLYGTRGLIPASGRGDVIDDDADDEDQATADPPRSVPRMTQESWRSTTRSPASSGKKWRMITSWAPPWTLQRATAVWP